MFFRLLSKTPVPHKALNFHPGTQRHNGMAPSPQHREQSLLLGSHPGRGQEKLKAQNTNCSILSLKNKNQKLNRPRSCSETFSFNLTAVWQEGCISPFCINLLKAFHLAVYSPERSLYLGWLHQKNPSKMNHRVSLQIQRIGQFLPSLTAFCREKGSVMGVNTEEFG